MTDMRLEIDGQDCFGSLAIDPNRGPMWVTEPVGADASGRE